MEKYNGGKARWGRPRRNKNAPGVSRRKTWDMSIRDSIIDAVMSSILQHGDIEGDDVKVACTSLSTIGEAVADSALDAMDAYAERSYDPYDFEP